MSLSLCPITLREARAFVTEHHRHHAAPQGALFAIACEGRDPQATDEEPAIVGVVIVGRPVARMAAVDDYTAEVTRLCTLGDRNACSMLYQAAWRAWRAMGGRKLITYTLPAEGGGSLRAAGWTMIGEAGGGSWSRPSRPRVDLHPKQVKIRRERAVGDAA